MNLYFIKYKFESIMTLIQSLNSYLLNDVSHIIHSYYFDSDKVNEIKKTLILDYKERIICLSDNEFKVITDGQIPPSPFFLLYKYKRSTVDAILKFDKQTKQLVISGYIPPNY